MRIRSRLIVYLFLLICGVLISRISMAIDYETNRSTNTRASSTLSKVTNCHPGDILGSLLINTRGTSGETITIYDSSGTATNSLGVVDLSTASVGATANSFNEYHYQLRVSSCITFSKSGSTGDATILWQQLGGNY